MSLSPLSEINGRFLYDYHAKFSVLLNDECFRWLSPSSYNNFSGLDSLSQCYYLAEKIESTPQYLLVDHHIIFLNYSTSVTKATYGII
jgi:hypothetical protein